MMLEPGANDTVASSSHVVPAVQELADVVVRQVPISIRQLSGMRRVVDEQMQLGRALCMSESEVNGVLGDLRGLQSRLGVVEMVFTVGGARVPAEVDAAVNTLDDYCEWLSAVRQYQEDRRAYPIFSSTHLRNESPPPYDDVV
jgi:hypothetical protein